MSARLYAVSYDIPSDNRRVKVANTLKSYGERVQYSVFECWLTQAELDDLSKRLERLFEPSEDSIRFYRTHDEVRVMGQGSPTVNPDLLII
jgi:CRISPR-associated protein Cas2